MHLDGEVLPCRPVRRVGGEGDPAALHAGQQEGGFAGFGEVPRGDEHGVVVADRPQAPADCLKRQFWCSKSAHRPIYAPYFQAFHLHFKQLPWSDPKRQAGFSGENIERRRHLGQGLQNEGRYCR